MLDEELTKISEEKLPAKNLKYALLGLGYSILASISSYLAIDSFKPRSGQTLFWIIIGLYYLLTAVSGVYAVLACKNSLKSLQNNKNARNYIALTIGGLLILGIIRQILRHI